MQKFRKSFIILSGIIFFIILVVIYFIYYYQLLSLKHTIFNSYKNVYIENKKYHLKDIINHIFSEISVKRKNLRLKIKNNLKEKTEILYSYLQNNYDSSNFKSFLFNLDKIFKNKKVYLFIIDISSGRYVFSPSIKISSKKILKLIDMDNNSKYIIAAKKFTPKKWIIGTIGKYSDFEKDLKKFILKNLYKYRYEINKSGYIFVVGMIKEHGKLKAIRLVNPNRPKSLQGKEIPLDVEDINGKKFFLEMIDKCFNYGEGYVKYKFKIPQTEKIGEKITYVKYLKDWNWIIGTGFYLDIFNQLLSKRDKDLKEIMKDYNFKFATSIFLLHGAIFLLFIFYIFKIMNKIDDYVKEIKENEKFKETLINLIPNPLFVMDVEGNFLDINPSFEAFFGIKKNQINIINDRDNYQEVNVLRMLLKADLLLEKDKRLNGKNRIVTELDIRDSNRAIRRVNIYKSFFYKDNRLAGLIGIIFDITEQKVLTDKLYSQVIKDELTGAFNRRHLNHIFPMERDRALRNNYKLSVIMFDIDFFKKINDTYGHQTGDKVLKTLVTIVKENIRKYDYLFRIGGEEFLVLLINADYDIAFYRAEKLRKTIESYNFDERFRVTISLGVTEVRGKETLKNVLKRVDTALYKAKNEGRNKTVVL